MIEEKKKQEIAKRLNERVQNFSCPMCHKGQFTIVDGYVLETLQNDYKNLIIGGGQLIPSVIIVCNNCGYLSQHSLGVLGLLND